MPSLAGVFADCAPGGAGLDEGVQVILSLSLASLSLPPSNHTAVNTGLPNMTRPLGFHGFGDLRPRPRRPAPLSRSEARGSRVARPTGSSPVGWTVGGRVTCFLDVRRETPVTRAPQRGAESVRGGGGGREGAEGRERPNPCRAGRHHFAITRPGSGAYPTARRSSGPLSRCRPCLSLGAALPSQSRSLSLSLSLSHTHPLSLSHTHTRSLFLSLGAAKLRQSPGSESLCLLTPWRDVLGEGEGERTRA